MRMLKRITRHMGPTRPFQVYLGMYSGMCVWYDTCAAAAKHPRLLAYPCVLACRLNPSCC